MSRVQGLVVVEGVWPAVQRTLSGFPRCDGHTIQTIIYQQLTINYNDYKTLN